MLQPQYCSKCKDSVVKGYIQKRKRGTKDDTLVPCECLIEFRKQAKLELKFQESNLPLACIERTFEDYLGERSKSNIKILEYYIYNFQGHKFNPFIYLWGTQGTQKTTLASIVAKELIIKFKRSLSVFYVEDMEILVKNFGSFKETDEQKEFKERFLDDDLVILDEAFFNKYHTSVSDYQLRNIKYALKHRLEVKRKPTIFISNVSPIDIKKNGFTDVIQSLIIRNCEKQILKFEDKCEDLQNDFDISELQVY